jgi:hypothetical protein
METSDDDGSADTNEDDATTIEDDNASQWSELERLQQESKPLSEDRNLFIPIFALVSLLGLFGSYTYELLRLQARGELYLPWDS